MKKTLLSGPAVEPLSLAEAKAHLRLDAADEDALVERLIAAARAKVESDTRLVTIAQAWRVSLEAWPRQRTVTLPVQPLLAVDVVRALDGAGVATIVPASDYEVDFEAGTVTAKAAAGFAPGVSAGGFEIDFTAGFGPAGADVPAPLRQAMLMLAAHWFEQRSAVAVGDLPQTVPAGVAALTAPYRRMTLC
jgi:uncharacterized phiE125 gp8 family phage protein